jgi:hypothetical protein
MFEKPNVLYAAKATREVDLPLIATGCNHGAP